MVDEELWVRHRIPTQRLSAHRLSANRGGSEIAVLREKWMVKTSISRLFCVAVIAELVPSWCVWILSPTESVRIWYPTVWSYIGEHFLLWYACLLIMVGLFKPFQEQIWSPMPISSNVRPLFLNVQQYALFAGLCLISDVSASLLIVGWGWLGNASFPTRLFYTGNLLNYLRFREPIFFVALTVASIVLHRPTRNRTDDGALQAGQIETPK
jgi:hypothetical protein